MRFLDWKRGAKLNGQRTDRQLNHGLYCRRGELVQTRSWQKLGPCKGSLNRVSMPCWLRLKVSGIEYKIAEAERTLHRYRPTAILLACELLYTPECIQPLTSMQ